MPREKSLTSTPKRTPRKKVALKSAQPVPAQFVGPEHRAALIAEAAYFRAQRRGFAPGHDVEDWLLAEAEVDAQLLQQSPAHLA